MTVAGKFSPRVVLLNETGVVGDGLEGKRAGDFAAAMGWNRAETNVAQSTSEVAGVAGVMILCRGISIGRTWNDRQGAGYLVAAELIAR